MPERSEPTVRIPPVVAPLLTGPMSNVDLTKGLLASFANLSKSVGGSAVTAAALAGMTQPVTALAGQTAQALAQQIGAGAAASAASIAGKQIASLFPSPSLTASLTALTERRPLVRRTQSRRARRQRSTMSVFSASMTCRRERWTFQR